LPSSFTDQPLQVQQAQVSSTDNVIYANIKDK